MSTPIDKTLEQIRSDLFARISQVQEEYIQKGWLPRRMNLNKGIIRGLIEIWAWGLYQLYLFLSMMLAQILVKSSDGSWLNLHCDGIEVSQKPATKALGTVRLTRTESQGNVPVPAGRVFKTQPDGTGRVLRFVTTEETVLQDGETSVSVPVVSEDYGNAANVSAGQISEIVTTIPGVDGVENHEDWLDTEGADLESEGSLKERYTLTWKGNNGCNKYAYEGWARGVTGVAGVSILDQHPRGQGTVDVVVRGSAGVPTAELLTKVEAAIQSEVPINDDFLVRGVAPVSVSITGNLVLVYGDPDTILADVQTQLNALFSANETMTGIFPFDIGEDVSRDRLVAVIMTVPGIKRIEFTSPTEDQTVPKDGLAVLTQINLTTSWAVEA